MAEKLKFDLVSPERMIMSGEVDQVIVPGTEGQFGVFAGHAPVMSALRPGMVDIVNDNQTTRIFVRGGFAEVTSVGLTVLAEEAIPEEELSAEVLAQKIKNAEEDVSDAKDDKSRQNAEETLNHLREVQQALLS